MARICGVCQRPPREGEEMRPIRLREPEDLEQTKAKELGLYSSCLDCVEAHRERFAERNDMKPEEVTNHMMC